MERGTVTADQRDGLGTPAEGSGEPIKGASATMPPIPDSIREAARLAPAHWLGMVDPTWTGEGAPPSWALVGQWRSSPEGEIVEWRDNEEYRPSPSALGWPEPTDDVDAAVQLAATGYGPGQAVAETLAALPEVAVLVTPAGAPLAATAPDGTTPVIPVFTSPAHLHAAGRLAYELMSVRALADQLPADHLVYVNPSAPVSMTVDTGMLREALERVPVRAAGDSGDPPAPRPSTIGGDLPAVRDA